MSDENAISRTSPARQPQAPTLAEADEASATPPIEVLIAEIKAAAGKLESLRALNEGNRRLLRRHRAIAARLALENAVMRSQRRSVDIPDLNALVVGLSEERENLRREVNEVRQELSAIKASTSWRITAPLRLAIHLLRASTRRLIMPPLRLAVRFLRKLLAQSKK